MSTLNSQHRVYRRILRRETHSPRSVLAITVAVTVIVLCAYIGTEIILAMLNRPALLAAPQDMLTTLGEMGTAPIAPSITIGIILMILGLLLIVGALTPGRRARHQLASARAAVVVDNEVIASALARYATHAGNTNPGNAIVTISARRAVVRMTPTSGIAVRRDAVSDAVREQLAAFELEPPVRASVVVSSSGKVGA
jgi:hypothetical protein